MAGTPMIFKEITAIPNYSSKKGKTIAEINRMTKL